MLPAGFIELRRILASTRSVQWLAGTALNRLRHGTVNNRTAENGFDQIVRSERAQRVRAVLAEIKPAQAQLLLLRASGHSYKELSADLEMEPGSVGTLLVRAEAAFEQRYRELFGSEEDV